MKFSEADMRRVDPIEAIRAHPEMYLPYAGLVHGIALVSCLIADVLNEADRQAVVSRNGNWWLVGSDVDWMASAISSTRTVRDLFAQIVPFPEAGQNAMRSEVLLTAFARDVIVFDESCYCIIKGQIEPIDSLFEAKNRHPEWRRAVAFQMH